MKGFFSYDSKLTLVLNIIADVVLVNILYLLCCLPVVTLGAARAALYTAGCKWFRKEESGVKNFLKAFANNLRESTPITLCFLVVALLFCYCTFLVYVNDVPGRMGFYITLTVALVVLAMILSQVFMCVSRFSCTFLQYIQNALILGFYMSVRSVCHVALFLLPWVLLFCLPDIFFNAIPFWLLVYFSGQGYLNAAMVCGVYDELAAEHQSRSSGTEVI